MKVANQSYEIRCPIHGFIAFSDWEREVINHPAFQRLRRIRQLAWTDQVYPGATHTRFEHSLGVMHIASQLFDALVRSSSELLKSAYRFTPDDIKRDKQIVRFTALLHDTGHGPFSHAAEDLFPKDGKGKHYKHEAYSATVIRHTLKQAIEEHPLNGEFDIKADEVAGLLEGNSQAGRRLLWRELVDGQMDADRMDYLLRDSLHIGVDYGRYDWRRLLNTIRVIEMPPRPNETSQVALRVGVTEGGVHAAEALVLARYYMFTQVYFHKTRVAYDHHFREAMKTILSGEPFPPPTPVRIDEYLEWNDWRVLGCLAEKEGGGEHGERLRTRNHYREVFHTPESPREGDLTTLRLIEKSLGNLVAAKESSKTSTYKLEASDISVVTDDNNKRVRALSDHSPIVSDLNKHLLEIVRLYSKPEDAEVSRAKITELLEDKKMSEITFETRVAVLARMVNAAPDQTLGRTQLMKLFYFLQELKEVPLGYDFRLFTYGPFDSEVLSDLSSACSRNAVIEDTIQYSRGYGYTITPAANAEKLSSELANNYSDIAGKADEVVREFGSYGAAELELRSTIFLWTAKQFHPPERLQVKLSQKEFAKLNHTSLTR